ncbi:MAG: squalene/phytoene synthase family protein [Alphaproteobacteria bacterium]|nr:squalene/phytoene synthase family protein [Alphaproteobacteria bacterium]
MATDTGSTAEVTDGVRQLANVARDHAYDRYVQALLIKPASLRPEFFLLAAFHGELARIPFLVREPMMGEIRLQWWRDVVLAARAVELNEPINFGSPLANQVVQFLVRNRKSETAFDALIDARGAELSSEAFTDERAFEGYLDGIATRQLEVGSELLGLTVDEDAKNALQAAGRAIAIAEVAQRLPRHLSLGRCPVPLSVVACKILDQVPLEEFDHLIRNAIAALADRAKDYLAAYRGAQARLSPKMTQVALPLALVEPYFQALHKRSWDPMQTASPKTPMTRFVRLWWAATRKRL